MPRPVHFALSGSKVLRAPYVPGTIFAYGVLVTREHVLDYKLNT